MPIVTIQGTTPGARSVTAGEKAQLIKGARQLLLDVLKKPVESTFVVIEEIDTDNWGGGGFPALEYRKKLARITRPQRDDARNTCSIGKPEQRAATGAP